MPPKNKTTPLCITLEDRLILKTKLLTHLSTHPALQFPSPSLPPKDRRIPSHLSTSHTSYIPYSALLSSVHKAPMKLPLTGQQWHWLRKFCYPSFFYKGPSISGFQELQPRGFLRLTLTERAFVRSEMGKANGQVRVRVVPQGVMVVAIYFLFKGNFFPAETPELSEEDDPNSLFLPTTIPKSAPPPPIPFTSYTHHRYPYWKALLTAEPWITIWWTTKAIGHIINTVWIWQDHEETDPKLKRLKRDLQEEIAEALIKLVDSVYLNLVDCDVRLAGGSGGGGGVGVWGEGGGGGGNTCVNATISKLFSESKHKLEEWPVHGAKIEDIRETRDLWDELCRHNKERRNGGAPDSSSEDEDEGEEDEGSEDGDDEDKESEDDDPEDEESEDTEDEDDEKE
ncbi:hypothetical protein BKA61DRAFT_719924 [Leptodontidium sp. MPI-SDFR-AT-0119]|nr:hypothetical protein BKA61DRAFT_719924 [Leptodontidium sp. MPI-SDFR-AT-0119]